MKGLAFLLALLLFIPVPGSVEKSGYDGIDDAAHFKYYQNESHIIHWYEWWYANLKDGKNGVVVMFFTFGNLNKIAQRVVGVFAVFLDENESVESLFFNPFVSFHLDYEKCNVSIGENRFYEEGGKFFVEYAGKNLYIHMEMDGGGMPYGSVAALEEWQWAGWYVALPYGEGEAIIKYNGKEYRLHGKAYHDHNWGMRKIGKFNWDWGEFGEENYSIIYGIAGHEEMKGGVHFINGSTHVFVPYGKIKEEYLEWNRISGFKKPVKIHVYGGDANMSVDFYVEMERAYILGYGKMGKPYLLGRAYGYVETGGVKRNFDTIGFYEHHGRFE